MKKKNVALVGAVIATAATGYLAVKYTRQFIGCCKLLAAGYAVATTDGQKAAELFKTASEKIPDDVAEAAAPTT